MMAAFERPIVFPQLRTYPGTLPQIAGKDARRCSTQISPRQRCARHRTPPCHASIRIGREAKILHRCQLESSHAYISAS
jgi:hypothetical protein